MNLVRSSRGVITDSGGVQEETTYLGIPCITLRGNTERPITVTLGTNRLYSPERLREAVGTLVRGDWPSGAVPPLWDGRTARRCVERLLARFG
jgi:UDP-N-acetylglucosamine 2-epimerase (non-hydrolysing)